MSAQPINAAPAWTLYERTEVLADLLDQIESPATTDEQRANLVEQLEREVIGTREKVDSIGRALSAWEAASEHAASELRRLSERKRSFDTRAERLKSVIEDAMCRLKLSKLEGYTSSFRRQRNSPAVSIWDEQQLPEECWRAPVVLREPDKARIRELLKSGEAVPGASLLESHHIRRA